MFPSISTNISPREWPMMRSQEFYAYWYAMFGLNKWDWLSAKNDWQLNAYTHLKLKEMHQEVLAKQTNQRRKKKKTTP